MKFAIKKPPICVETVKELHIARTSTEHNTGGFIKSSAKSSKDTKKILQRIWRMSKDNNSEDSISKTIATKPTMIV